VLLTVLGDARMAAQFAERAATAGVDLFYPTAAGGHSRPGLDAYAVGGAAAACDLDGDGWTDLIVARAGAPCLVFINNRDGTYREEAKARGLDTVSDIGGIAVGDLQNRGLPDVVMVPVAGPRQFLFVNDGTGRFTELAAERGVDLPVTQEPHLGQSVSLVDYDRDGYLDIHVSEWSVLSSGENARHNALLRNRGRAQPGFFENTTAAAGLVQPPAKNIIANYATAWADFDGDGYPDVFIAGDFGTSQLWWNNGDGTFTDGTVTSGIANPADGMGLAVLDYDGDGKLDLFVSAISLTNPSSTTDKGYISDNKLFRYAGNRRFSELALGTPVRETGWGWGVGSLDANNDGWPDLVVTNGYIGAGPNFAAGRTDPTKFFLNRTGTFSDETAAYRITDTGLGRSVVVLDYDNDGREDVFITQTEGHRLLYRNESPVAAHWLNLRFVGTASNRDGYGCEVRVTAGGRTQLALYNPTNAYIGQREPRLHFGLGTATTVEKISIKWPSGATQELLNVAADRTLTVTETSLVAAAPTITTQPRGVAAAKDSPVTLTAAGQGSPAPVYLWFKDGVIVPGQSGPVLTLERVQPIDAGVYTVTLTNPSGTITSSAATITVTADLAAKSVARWWNEALLDGIRKDTPNPPVHARNLFHLSATLWDAFWTYEREGWAAHHEVFTREVVAIPLDESARLAAQQQAMSFAAYTVIRQRFANSPGAAATLAGIRWLMQRYGYNPDDTDPTAATPAAVGLRIGARVLALALTDGANESGGYANATGFVAANPPLVVRFTGVGTGVDPNRWQPLDLLNTITQNGLVLGAAVQPFVGANAKTTRTFSLARRADGLLAEDPGPPPTLTGADRATYIAQAVEVLTYSSQLTAADGATLDISPGRLLNNTLGTNAGRGHAVNPATGRAYAPNVVNRGDYARVLAEFWADGPSSETPPGHWNLVFNQISDDPRTAHRFLGAGPTLRRLEWDVCGYLALNAAMHDAACCAWTLKWQYNSARPITMIRYLAGRGQSSDPALPRYHPEGLPLIPGQIELITAASAAPGQRHEFLTRFVGQIAVKAWLGTPATASETAGVGWVLGEEWVPYQRETFVTPAFPGYTSGHSTFSRAGAEVLTRLTGSEFFPGGLATYDFAAGKGLGFEAGPAANVQLQWATYYDAADQAGLSRLYGGIHISVDDFVGRRLGSKVGLDAFARFLAYYGSSSIATLGASPAAAPAIVAAPASVATAAGRTARFAVEVTGAGPMTYEWLRGTTVVGTTRTLELANLTAASVGDYRVVVRNAAGSVTSAPARLAVRGAPALANLSIRAAAGPGERALIAGFVVRGAGAKNVLVRGIGPGLTPLGVTDVLPAPVLTIVGSSALALARNDRWDAAATPPGLFATLGAFPLAAGSADTALQLALPSGSYTATVTEATNRTGAALVEIYEADSASDRLVNLSARAFVGPGAGLGIAGFVVRGEQPGRYLIRGVGPALAQFGLTGALADPVLTLTTSDGTLLATNRGWSANAHAADLAIAATQLGAFPLATASRDAALLVTLAPGAYTAQLTGATDTGGLALLEVYEVP
jgi:hypothetical protein